MLDISQTGVKHIPSTIQVGRLYADNSEIENIGEGFTAKRAVISGPISELPPGMVIEQMLDVTYTNIKTLPDDLIVKDYTMLPDCFEQTELPPGVNNVLGSDSAFSEILK